MFFIVFSCSEIPLLSLPDLWLFMMDSFAAWNFKNLNWLKIGKIQKVLCPEYQEFQLLHVISYITPNFYFARSKSNENHLHNWTTSWYKAIIRLGTMTLIFHFVSRAFWTFNRTSIRPNTKQNLKWNFIGWKITSRKYVLVELKKAFRCLYSLAMTELRFWSQICDIYWLYQIKS